MLAQSAEPEVDPPGRVARLADFSGQVWLYSPDSGEWVGAVRNQPVAAGDRIATEADAHAELQLGSTTLRLDSSTELEVATLLGLVTALAIVASVVTAYPLLF